jgi:hypothetical protein
MISEKVIGDLFNNILDARVTLFCYGTGTVAYLVLYCSSYQ